MKDPNYTPSVRSASYSTTTRPNPPFQTASNHGREQSPASSARRGPYPDLGPQSFESRPTPSAQQQRSFTTPSHPLREQSPASSGRRGPYPDLGPESRNEEPRPTPTKRRSSWLPHFGRPPSRGKSGDSQTGNRTGSSPRRAFSHDITSMLSRGERGSGDQKQRQGSVDGGQRFRPPFWHLRSGSNASPQQYASPQNSFGPQYASPQNSFGPGAGMQYASPQNSFGPGVAVHYASPQGSYIGTPGRQQGRQDSFGQQRSDALPLPPGVMIDAREVSPVASNTPPPVAPQIHLDLPPSTLRMVDDHWLSTSPAHTGSPHLSISAANSSQSPHPSSHLSSRHPSGVPSMTESERLEVSDRFDVNKELPRPDLEDHEHTGVKPPVPIGKYQPSWDPFNATPIKEEGSEYSFGRGSVSPPKISPPVLTTVEEDKRQQEAAQNEILAGVAGVGLAAGAATTVAAISEQVQEEREERDERKTEVHTTEVSEDKIYDASPPPKDKGRSLDLRPAQPAEIALPGAFPEDRAERKTEVYTTEIDEGHLYAASPPPKSKRRSLDLRAARPAEPAIPVALAAGTFTTAAAIQEQSREMKNADTPDREEGICDASPPPRSTATAIQEQLQVPPRDDKEDGIYDASPPPKSKRRSMDLRTAPVIPVVVTTGTVATAAAIRDQAQARREDDKEDDKDDWEIVEHHDAVLKDEPSYFPPVITPQPQPKLEAQSQLEAQPQVFNQRLDIDHGVQSRGHNRGISGVSAVSAMTDGTIEPGEVVQAEEMTIVRESFPVERQINDAPPSTLRNIHQFMRTTSDDSPLDPPRPGFMGMGQPAAAQSTPTMESVPGFFPETPNASVYDTPVSVRSSPMVRTGSDKPLPPIDKSLPWEHPDDNKVTPQASFYNVTPTQPSPYPLRKPGTPGTQWEAATSQVELRDARKETPSVVSSEDEDEDDEKPYAAALARLDNVRNNTQQISSEPELRQPPFVPVTERFWVPEAQQISEAHEQQGTVQEREIETRKSDLDEVERLRLQNAQTVHQQQGTVRFSEPEPRQRVFDEAEQLRLQNAQTIQQTESQTRPRSSAEAEQVRVHSGQINNDRERQGMARSREPESRHRVFDEAEQFRVRNAQTVEQERFSVAAAKVVADTPNAVSDDEDDEDPYAEEMARLPHLRNNAQQVSSGVGPPQMGMAQSREPETRQRDFDEAERFRVQNAQQVGNGRHQQQSMKSSSESESRERALDEEARFRVQNAEHISHEDQQGSVRSREPQPRQRSFHEIEQFRTLNAQVLHPHDGSEQSRQLGPRQRDFGEVEQYRVQNPPAVSQPQQGMLESREPETRQRSSNEAEQFRAHNAQQIGRQSHPQQSTVQSREPQPRQQSFDEAERYRSQNAQIVERAGVGLAGGALITAQVIPRQMQENREERRINTTEIDDDDIYGEKSIYLASPPPKSIRRSLEMRPAVSLGPATVSSPPARPISGAVGQRGTPTVVTPVLAPQPGQGRVPSDFTPRTGSAAGSVQAPPMLGQEQTITPRSPLGVAPVQQRRQFPQPLQQSQNQNQTAYQQSAYPIGGTPYSKLPQATPPGPIRGQHQAYAAQLAQGPPQLKKTNSDANRNVLQKRPSSAASSNKGKEAKEKKKSFFSGLFGARRRSAIAETEKERKDKDGKVPLVAVLGAAGVAAKKQNPEQKRYQEQQRRLSWQQMAGAVISKDQGQDQRMSLQQMSGAIPPPNQQFEARDPRFLQRQQGQQQQVQAPPGGPQRILQGGPQPQQQQYDSPPIPGPYAYVRGDGSYEPANQGPMILNPHQQQQAGALRQSQQPVFADRRSYDEYMRQQQAAQAQQQGHYANLPPPPATSYTQGRQESVPPNFRRASQEYVRDLNRRSSEDHSRRDSNSMAAGQQLNQTYTQQLAAQRPPSQRKEPIAVAIPPWKRAIRDTPGTTSPVQRTEASPPPVLGPQGDFPHLTAFNPNANTAPDTPESQGRSRPFLGLNEDRRNSNLSTEDLLARSPARAQFGQQAPYQLSLPGGDEEDELDSPHSRRAPENALVGAGAGAAAVALDGAAATEHRQKASSPLRESHHQQAMNVPVPDTAFSPLAERGVRGGDVPPPPLPKWSAPPTPSGMAHNVQLGHPTHHSGAGLLQPAGQPLLYPHNQNQMLLSPNVGGVGRSNTVMSDVSSITVESAHTPSPRQHAPDANATGQGHGHQKSLSTSPAFGQQLNPMATRDSVSPRSSPNDTPVVQNATSLQPIRPSVAHHRTEPVVQRIHIPSDIPSSVVSPQQPPPMPTSRAPSPPHPPVPAANATGGFVIPNTQAPMERPTIVTQHPDHSGLIYDNSREGLIVVEDATVRRVNQGRSPTPDDEPPVMSATSFPGDEWRPYGWDEGYD